MFTSEKTSLSARRRAFTLIELLVVIAIIGILAAILFPTMGAVRQNSKAATSISNLRQIGIGMDLILNEGAPGLPKGYYPCYGGTDFGPWVQYGVLELVAEKFEMAYRKNGKFFWPQDPATTIFQNPFDETDYNPASAGSTAGYGYNTLQLCTSSWKHASHNLGIYKSANEPTTQVNFSKQQIFNVSNMIIFAENDADLSKTNRYTSSQYGWSGQPSDDYKGGGHYLFADGHVAWMSREDLMAQPTKFYNRSGK